MLSRCSPYLLSAPAAALLIGLLGGPLLLLVRVSLYEPARGRGFFTHGTWTLANYGAISDGLGLQLIGVTVGFALAIALLTVPVAYALALFVRSLSPKWRRVALAGVLIPKFASALVLLFGLQRFLERGPIATILAETYLILPYAVLLLYVQVSTIDPALESAARGLGASAWQTFCRITLPLSIPGLILTGQLCLMWGMGAFLGPMLLGGPDEVTLSVEAHRQAFEYGRWPRAAALAVLLVATVGAGLGVYSLVLLWFRREPR